MADESSSVSGLVAELFRAANEVEHLTMAERSRLMVRSAMTIADMRDRIASKSTPINDSMANFSAELHSMAVTPEVFTAENVSSILLSAAETIRTLKILLDSEADALTRSIPGNAVQ